MPALPDHPVLSEWARTLCDSGLLAGARHVLVACSGGADSTALARVLAACVKRQEFALRVGHVHHGLRGESADADRDFVAALARDIGADFVEVRRDVRSLAEEGGLSLETAAREARYEAFREWARELSLDVVALGHHREDQRETVLLRLARGTGLAGLAGMKRSRSLGELPTRIVRPFLARGRDEILALLARLDQPYRDDPSNAELEFTRNRVRHEVLPLIESRIHPQAGRAIDRLAALAAVWRDDLERLGERALAESVLDESETLVRLHRARLLEWPSSVRASVWRRALSRLVGDERSPSARVLARLEELLLEPVSRRLELRARVRVVGDGDEITLRVGEDERQGHDRAAVSRGDTRERALDVDGDPIMWGDGWRLRAQRGDWSGGDDGTSIAWASPEALGDRLLVRARRPGDRACLLGAPGRKKLKELHRAAGIKPHVRDSLPLIVLRAAPETIVWPVGLRITEPFRARPGPAVRLMAERVQGFHDAGS